MGRCSICHYLGPADGPKHDARTCPLKNVQCRRSLPEGHPLFHPGQCVEATCIHKALCTTCGLPGHQYGTQKLNPTRFKINDKGIVVRKQNRAPLTPDDFVCTLMTELSISTMVDNTQSDAAAKAIDAHERRVSTVRLLDNVNSSGVDLDETIRLMEHKGTKSALLSGKNKAYFLNLTKRSHLGAVEAARIAAEAAESSMDEESGTDAAVEETDSGEKTVRKKGASNKSKAARSLAKARKTRTDRYAMAVAMGRAGSRAKPGVRGVLRSPGADAYVKGRSSAAASSPGKDVIDVDGANATLGTSGWPAGSRTAFTVPLPSFFSPSFAATPAVKIAHMVLEKMCQCTLKEIDEDLAGFVVKGAVEGHVRGYMLTSGTLTSAQVADWLCAVMPTAMKSSTLTTVARAVSDIVDGAATAAATAAGLNTPAQRPLCPE